MKRILIFIILCTLLVPTWLQADTPPLKIEEAEDDANDNKDETKDKGEEKDNKKDADEDKDKDKNKDDFDFSGYIDGSYNYLLRDNQFISGVQDRVFDLNENGLTLQQAAITIAKQPEEGFGGVFNALIGRDAFTLTDYGLSADLGNGEVGFATIQSFLQYAKGPFTIMGGLYQSLCGYEQVDPTLDSTFSRGNLSYAFPGELLGVRGIYKFNKDLYVSLGVTNNWDSVRDLGLDKTIELGVTYTLNDCFSLSTSGYSGEQRLADRTATGPTGRRNLFDIFATYNVTPKLELVSEYEYAMQTQAALPNDCVGRAIWQGISAFVKYKFNDQWRIVFRFEDFNDQNGYRTGVAQNWKEATVAVGYAPIKNMEIRAETRHDFSNAESFVEKNGFCVKNNQQSFGLEAYYKFD